MDRPPRTLIVSRWAFDLAHKELGRDLLPSDVPPFGFWDKVEVAEPVHTEGCWNCGSTAGPGCCIATVMY